MVWLGLKLWFAGGYSKPVSEHKGSDLPIALRETFTILKRESFPHVTIIELVDTRL